jgi:hypothetical protein
MNLVETAKELEYIPTDQLAQMVNDPTSRIPSFLALSEVQRRNQMKKSYDAEVAAQNKPDTTVAEEAVAELTGLAGMSSNQLLSSPTTGESPVGGGVPASMMMAEGGLTGYQEGGRSFMDQALDFRDPDGSINWTKVAGTGLTAASLFSPIGWGARGLWAGMKGLPALAGRFGAGYAKHISAPIGTAAWKAMTPKMRDAYMKRMTAEGAKFAGKKSVPLSVLGNIVQRRAGLTGGLGTVAYASGYEGDGKGEIDDTKRDVGNQLTSESGDSVPRATEASIDPYDMARMGFELMGARSTSELAKGLGGIASDIQTRKREEGIRESELEERAARTALYRAQAEGGEEERIINEINAINKAAESGAITIDDELKRYVGSLLEQLEALRGGGGMASAYDPIADAEAKAQG